MDSEVYTYPAQSTTIKNYSTYCKFRSLTCIALVLGLMLTFASLLSRESWKMEKLVNFGGLRRKGKLKLR